MRQKKLRQIDVANTFLYAPVDAEIFVEQPHRSNTDPNQVCHLLKSLYGIKQALRLWQQYLHARLIRIGFQQLPHNQAMYRLIKEAEYILLILYVDNLLYVGSTDNITTCFEGELQRDLSLMVSSTVTQYLGLNILDGKNTIYLNAAKYADTIAKRFRLSPALLPADRTCCTQRASFTGYIYRFEPVGPISWQSSKHELIALSSAEAEYIVLCSATKEGLYLRELLEEAKLAQLPSFSLFCDNQSAICIANKNGFANRTKHIALRYFFVKDEIEKGRLELSYCPTSEMAADYVTKKLGKHKFEYCMLLTGQGHVTSNEGTPEAKGSVGNI
ncbi:unnamed protein product [Closterium sp. NIES-54]